MEKKVKLRDGAEVLIRPMEAGDTERSYAFFAALPEEDRKYLRMDVARWDVVERRIRDHETGRVLRLVALAGGEIVADGALELAGHGWGNNVGEIRLIVAHSFQRKGLGMLMARELFFLAAQRKLDRIVVRMMRPQTGAVSIFRKLGFHDEFLIPEHVRDQAGQWQDMVIMRCNLEDLWREVEHLMQDGDWTLYR